MPTVTREDSNELNTVITIELPKNDYLPAVTKKLRDHRKKANFKGFRPGHVPMGLIKRRFGNSVLFDEVNEIVQKELNEYFRSENLDFLGQPLAVADESLTFDINKPQDYVFKFELGLTPKFEIQGTNLENVLPYYEIKIEEEMVTAEIDRLRKQFSDGFEEGATEIVEGDLLEIDLAELENGEPKEGGVLREKTFLRVSDVQNEQLKDDLCTATIGDSFDVNVYELEKNTKEHIHKYILDIEEDAVINETFRLTINLIKRAKKADLSEDFFKKIFPNDEIADEEAFKNKIQEEIHKSHKQASLQVFYREIHKSLVELNQFDIPDEFLKKWLQSQRNVKGADLESGYQDFARNVRWTLMRDRIAKEKSIEITDQDIENSVRGEVLRYFNFQLPPFGEMTNNMVEQVMSNKDEVHKRRENLLDGRVLEVLSEEVGKDVKEVSKEEFEAMQKAKETPAITEEENTVDTEAETVDAVAEVVEETVATEEENKEE